jgi:hypothetical protein
MPQGNPLAYSQQPAPMSLAEILSQALGGQAQMDPAQLQAMQQEMELRKYDQMMKMQGVQKAFAPAQPNSNPRPKPQQAGSLNPLAPLINALGQ